MTIPHLAPNPNPKIAAPIADDDCANFEFLCDVVMTKRFNVVTACEDIVWKHYFLNANNRSALKTTINVDPS